MIQLGEFEEAERAVIPLTKLEFTPGSDAQILFLAGWLDLRADRLEPARAWFERLVATHPDTPSGRQAAETLARIDALSGG